MTFTYVPTDVFVFAHISDKKQFFESAAKRSEAILSAAISSQDRTPHATASERKTMLNKQVEVLDKILKTCSQKLRPRDFENLRKAFAKKCAGRFSDEKLQGLLGKHLFFIQTGLRCSCFPHQPLQIG